VNALFSPRERSERLIAGGRIVLAVTSLAALWRDPSEPAKYAPIAYALLAAYVLYAIVIAAVVWRWRGGAERQALWTHGFDLAFFSAFMYFTSGPASPFIAYFVFSLVCATLRWQWRGTMWTAVAALTLYAALGYYFGAVLGDPSFEGSRFVIRGVYMAVVAYLLGQLGRLEQRTRREISALASWAALPSRSLEDVVARSLASAAEVHGAPCVAIAWGRESGPGELVVWRLGAIERTLEEGAEAGLVDLGLGGASLLLPANWRPGRELLVRPAGQLEGALAERPVRELRRRFGQGTVLSAPWRGELSAGRLFVVGLAEATSDDLLLVEISAALVGARIDTQLVQERRREAAATEERMRLARDLHDGVLQSLTAIGLRVAAVRRLLPPGTEPAESGLAELQRLLSLEQRDLRFVIRDLEPPREGASEPEFTARLVDLARRVEQEWRIGVDLAIEEVDEELDESVERDLYFLIREALINAARHAEASRVGISLERTSARRARLLITDDGHGFPFEGCFDLEDLASRQLGPRSLRERVASLGGTFRLESGRSGARLEIVVPT
jgi:signal transduction histidine kinase